MCFLDIRSLSSEYHTKRMQSMGGSSEYRNRAWRMKLQFMVRFINLVLNETVISILKQLKLVYFILSVGLIPLFKCCVRTLIANNLQHLPVIIRINFE